MDANKIIVALKASMNPTEHAAAESYLESCRKIIGFTPALMKVLESADIEVSLRQAAVVYVKNMITSFWSEKPEEEVHGDNKAAVFTIHEQDRFVIREAIINAIIQSPEVIRVQLAECVRVILMCDYPGRWPQVFPKIVECLSSADGQHCYAGLLVLLKLVKNYTYKKIKDQAPIIQPVKGVLPILYQRMVQLLPNNSQESAVLQKLIIKCINALVQYNFHPDLMTTDQFVDWMNLMCQVIEHPLPEEIQQIDVDDRPEQIWCKVKKWASRVVDNAFDLFGQASASGAEYKALRAVYSKSCAEPAVRTMLNVLHKYKSQEYVTPYLLHRALTLLYRAVSVQSTWKLLKDNAMAIITGVIFPLLCYSKQDEELWDSDPEEYVRWKYDALTDIVEPAMAGTSFITVCIKKRKMLDDVLSIIQHVLSQTSAAPHEVDGGLRLFGMISSSVLKKPHLSEMVDKVLATQVLPRLQDSCRFLRAKACWCIKEYSEFKFDRTVSAEAVAVSLVKLLLQDTEIPVQFEATLGLEMMLYDQDDAKKAVLPHLKLVLLKVLELVKKTMNDELNNAMSAVVSIFEADVIPIAVEVTTELCKMYVEMTAEKEMDEDCNITSLGVLATIQTLLDAAENHIDVIKQLEIIVLMLVNTIFERNIEDHIDQAFVLICCLNYAEITDALWNFYPTVFAAFKNCTGIDFFGEVMPVLYNYVVVGSSDFLDDPNRLRILLTMCSEVFAEDSMEECDCYAAKLLETVLLEFRGKIDEYVRPIVEMVLTRMSKEVYGPELRALCMSVLIAVVVYNTNMSIELLGSLPTPDGNGSLLDHFIKHWISDHSIFTGIHNRKLSVMGICAILEMQERPPIIVQMSPTFLPCCIGLFEGLDKTYAARAAEEGRSDDDSDLTDEESSASESSLTDGVEKVGDHEMEDVKSYEDDSSDEDEDEDDTVEYEEYETMIDRKTSWIDEYVLFKDTLTGIQQRDPQWYLALVTALTDEQKKQLEKISHTAEEKRRAITDEQMKQAAG